MPVSIVSTSRTFVDATGRLRRAERALSDATPMGTLSRLHVVVKERLLALRTFIKMQTCRVVVWSRPGLASPGGQMLIRGPRSG